jgi:hypothetical protein
MLWIIWFFINPTSYINSNITVVLQIIGLIQTIIAVFTFTFLPRNKDNSGRQSYFSDKYTLTYEFICENIYYSSLIVFQWLYYSNRHSITIKNNIILVIIENIFVFLPYVVIRPFTAKTSFCDSINNNTKENTASNKYFMLTAVWMTKIFYVIAKHQFGFYLNYLMFLGLVTSNNRYYVFYMLLFATLSNTGFMFLHTLKFRKIISARVSVVLYVMTYILTIYPMVHIINSSILFIQVLVLLGTFINFSSKKYQNIYQVFVMILLNIIRNI